LLRYTGQLTEEQHEELARLSILSQLLPDSHRGVAEKV
jgi:hypothetical protein